MRNEISVRIEIPRASLKYSTAPAGNGNVVAISAGSVVESWSKTFCDLLLLFEGRSKGVKVCLADVTIRQIVKTRRRFRGATLTLGLFLQDGKHNHHDGHRNDYDAQLNGAVHFNLRSLCAAGRDQAQTSFRTNQAWTGRTTSILQGPLARLVISFGAGILDNAVLKRIDFC